MPACYRRWLVARNLRHSSTVVCNTDGGIVSMLVSCWRSGAMLAWDATFAQYAYGTSPFGAFFIVRIMSHRIAPYRSVLHSLPDYEYGEQS
mmetsp:Transcript_20637/g.57343  ORF Transcript_20637/g.57343 Transcript_20637/m.57343 type:complete len:91 (-) Transcript_20637:470-742(-)